MATLHLRGVPEETVEQLRRIADRRRMSMNAVAVQELVATARACDNAALLDSLPELDVDPTSIVTRLDTERGGR